MNYILDYATKNNQQIDDANLISDFMINVIGAFEEEILNLCCKFAECIFPSFKQMLEDNSFYAKNYFNKL